MTGVPRTLEQLYVDYPITPTESDLLYIARAGGTDGVCLLSQAISLGNLRQDGSVQLGADWNAGAWVIGCKYITLSETTLPPLSVASTALVGNLNVEYLNGQAGAYYENRALASQAEAEAGSDNVKGMTPLRVAQAIAALSGVLPGNYSATTDPGVSDDNTQGWVVGSVWINTTSDEAFRCLDSTTSAAVWVKTTLSTDELATVALTGDSDDLTEGSTNLLLTASERSKIADVDKKIYQGANAQTGTSYTLVLADAGKIIEMNNASPNTLTIPPNSSVAFPLDTRIDVVQMGAGLTSISPGAGVTVNGLGTDLAGQYAVLSLWKRGTNEWLLFGGV